MAGQTRLRPISLTLLLLGALILLVFQSCHYLTPKAIQFMQSNTLNTREVAPDTLSSEIFNSGSNLHARQAINDDYTCAVGRPCKNGACCGASGNCGYGPKYCGDGCSSNCNATAECGEFAKTPGKICPLNVCCSQYGFCGTTEKFCDSSCQSNCGTPTPPPGRNTGGVRSKVVGYYEAWSSSRKCHTMAPKGIPIDGLTHVNFAFASIEPGTYKVTTMDGNTPANLFRDVADVASMKSGNSGLKVFISIGGWTFSDPGTVTQPLFGEIAADATKRATFANNVVAFMELYGFDGVDLDWEYPGAEDRGGKPEDTANFVKLLKTMREVFDSRPKKFGLTYTVPSSYWYLRWFDLPGSIDYVDWINLMSYDLHGFWDRLNPIGSNVYAHTNLTEIKEATNLLWRVGVPPEKVVFGVGFYGRSFTLKDPSCSGPGCPFGEQSQKGPCTGEGGIMGYFEIMDILKGGKLKARNADGSDVAITRRSEPIHLKDEAVKYMVYNDNQWISYDDSETFGTKTDWADGMGLGGLMIWAVDLDDDNFSALSGLMKKSIGTLIPPDTGSVNPNGNDVSQQWSNGGKCEKSSCDDRKDSQGVEKVVCKKEEGKIKVGERTCGKNKIETICCPTINAPSTCQWRGGETGGLCNGQCHQGEINLLSIRGSDGDGGHNHCTSGWQIFCCKADKWAELIDQCQFEKCDRECSSGYEAITTVYTTSECNTGADQGSPFSPLSNGYRKYCCPKPKAFNNCYWRGKGDCADNTCTNSKGEDDGSIEVMTDRYGDGKSTCRWGRNRVMCCNPPDIDAFSPVNLTYLFPELPPAANTVKFDVQSGIGSTGSTTQAGEGTWGMIVVDGPKTAVVSVNKRDDSHLEFLDCDKAKGEDRQTVRYICLNAGPDSNCDDMLLGGIEGTILKMPDSCGPGTYAVAHRVQISPDQTRPSHLEKTDGPVMELMFDYNFGLVKRDSGDIYFRIDYSSVPSYWSDIVNTTGTYSKRELMESRGFGNDNWWKNKYDSIRKSNEGVRVLEQTYSREVYANRKECSAGQDGYLDIKANVASTIEAKWGFTLIGMISPWRVSEAYTFFDANTKVGLDYDISARGDISSDSNIEFPLQRTALSMYEFRHPGIGHFRPWFNADVGVTGNIDLEGNFTISYQASTAGSISQGYPTAGLGHPYGYGVMSPKGEPFKGAIKRAAPGSLKIRTTTQTGLEIVFNKYGNSGEFLGVNITGTTDTYTALQVENNKYTVSVGSDKASAGLIYASGGSETIAAWNPDSSSTVLLGDRLGAKQVASGSPGDDKDPSKGPNPHYIEYDGDATLAHFKNMLSCPAGSAPTCGLIMCGTKNFDCSDDEDVPYTQYRGSKAKRRLLSRETSPSLHGEKEGFNSSGHGHAAFHHRKARAHLVPRAKKRKFEVPEPGNDKGKKRAIEYDDAPHISAGDWDGYPEADENYDNAYALADYDDCHDATIISTVVPDKADVNKNTLNFATEHIVEMNMLPTFLQQAAAGELPSGDTPALGAINGNFFINHWRQRDYLPATVPDLPGGESSRIMAERVPITLGSKFNRGYFVLLERDINNMKQRLWRMVRFFDVDAFATEFNNGEASIMEAVTSFRNAKAVFNYLNIPRVHRNMIGVLNNLRGEFQLYQTQWNSDNPNETINLVGYWDVWIRDFLRHFSEFTVGVAERSYLALQQLAPSGDDEFEAALVLIEDWIDEIKGSSVPDTGLQ